MELSDKCLHALIPLPLFRVKLKVCESRIERWFLHISPRYAHMLLAATLKK